MQDRASAGAKLREYLLSQNRTRVYMERLWKIKREMSILRLTLEIPFWALNHLTIIDCRNQRHPGTHCKNTEITDNRKSVTEENRQR
jgi:hypothetical protein